MDKHRKSCVHCGESRIRMRKTTKKMVPDRVLRNIQVDGAVYCLMAIGLALFSSIIVDDVNDFFKLCALGGGISVVLLPGWWFLRVSIFMHKRRNHYKCLKCAYTWDE